MTNPPPAGGDPAAAVAGHLVFLLLPSILGLGGGFQTIHAKFGADAPRVLTTVTGWVYWLSRGIVPTVVYTVWYHLQPSAHDSFAAVALCGLGSEAVLRSRFYLGERKASDGKIEEVARGIFDLLSWYQALCLKAAGDKLASERQTFIETLLGKEVDFLQLAKRARSNAGAWAIEEEKQKLQKLVGDLETKFRDATKGLPGPDLQQVNREFILELGYAAMRLVGRESLKTLFK